MNDSRTLEELEQAIEKERLRAPDPELVLALTNVIGVKPAILASDDDDAKWLVEAFDSTLAAAKTFTDLGQFGMVMSVIANLHRIASLLSRLNTVGNAYYISTANGMSAMFHRLNELYEQKCRLLSENTISQPGEKPTFH